MALIKAIHFVTFILIVNKLTTPSLIFSSDKYSTPMIFPTGWKWDVNLAIGQLAPWRQLWRLISP